MKILVTVAILAFFSVVGCKSDRQNKTVETAIRSNVNLSTLKGTYKGDFDGNPIYITLNYVSANNVAGYNVHKGLRRNIHGELEVLSDNSVELTLSEPGDNPYDGVFKIVFQPDLNSAKGEWTPNSSSSLKEKQFELERKKKANEQEMELIGEGYTLAGDHCDITFEGDGSCLFNYYEKITDSTFTQQMNTLKGTWERTGDKVKVNWQPNKQFNKRLSVFEITYYVYEQTGERIPNGIEGEGFSFSPAM